MELALAMINLKQLFNWRTLLPKFFACLSSLWVVLKPIHELLNMQAGWGEYFGLLIISGLAAVVWNWPRALIKHRFAHNDLTIRIIKGDVLAADTNIVVGFCDTFDTEIGKIIKQNSLQGQFQQKVFSGDIEAFEKKLNDLLIPERKFAINDPDKSAGKQLRFPIGTVLTLPQTKRYFLLAYTIMGNDLSCTPTTAESIIVALFRLWDCVRRDGQHEPVSIPVIATDAARSGLSRTTIIKLIILTFYTAHTAKPVTKGLDIYVFPTDIEHVDFNSVESFLTNM